MRSAKRWSHLTWYQAVCKFRSLNKIQRGRFRHLRMSRLESQCPKRLGMWKKRRRRSRLTTLSPVTSTSLKETAADLPTSCTHAEQSDDSDGANVALMDVSNQTEVMMQKNNVDYADLFSSDRDVEKECARGAGINENGVETPLSLESADVSDTDDAVMFVREIKVSESSPLKNNCDSPDLYRRDFSLNPNTGKKFEENRTRWRDIENCSTSNTDQGGRIVICDEDEPQERCRDVKNAAEDMNVSALSTFDDEDLVIVADNKDNNERMDRRTLNRVVKSVVFHYLEENCKRKPTIEYVLGRLNTLYHCDFTDRRSEVEVSAKRAITAFHYDQYQYREISPGLRHIDLDTLSLDNWLNDIIINRYMTMIVDDKPHFAALSSFWPEEMLRGKGPALPQGWEKMRKILAPVCAASHWSLLAYDPSRNMVSLYSSMEISDVEIAYAQGLGNYFSEQLEGSSKTCSLHILKNLPLQANENDCGVYVCMFARCIVCGNSYNIAPEQVTEFSRMAERGDHQRQVTQRVTAGSDD